MRRVCIVLNLLLAVLAFWGLLRGDPGSRAAALAALLLFLLITTGIISDQRWITLVAALPLILVSLLFAFVVLVGGWAWGPQNATTMNVLIFGALFVAALEVVSIVITARRRPASH